MARLDRFRRMGQYVEHVHAARKGNFGRTLAALDFDKASAPWLSPVAQLGTEGRAIGEELMALFLCRINDPTVV